MQGDSSKPELSNFTKEEIREELDRILSSEMFSRSSVLSNFLKFIVEETIEGDTENLKEYTIAVSALGKADDFNPQIDAIVRIHAGRLRRLLNDYYKGPGLNNSVKIEVVKGTYVPAFRSQSVQSSNFKQEDTEKKHGLKAIELSPTPTVYSRSKLTLAVLPFRNLCPDDEYQFFVDGFGEELTRIFSAEEDIAVVAHFSSLKYASISEDIRVIGADLGVHYVITGSVKRSNKEIRVNVALIETVKGIQIWSKNYTHDLEKNDMIDIQDQIDHDVFSILSGQYGFIVRTTLGLVESDMKQDIQSFDALLWNYYAQMTHGKDDCLKSRYALEKALEKDPNNVMCLVVLGDTYLFTHSLGYPNIKDPINEAIKLIKKAIKLEPRSQYAHIIYGWANIYLGDKKASIKAFENSIKLGYSSASVDGQLGFGFACLGEYKRAQFLLHKSLDLNPYCPWWYYLGFFLVYYHLGNYTEALNYAQKIDVSEDVFLDPLLKVAAMGQLGLLLEAQLSVQRINENFSQIMNNLEATLSTFLLDKVIIEEIIQGAKKAGVNIN